MSTSSFCAWHRVPRAHIDPITCASDALAVIGLAVSDPPVDETIVVLLDHARRGMSVIVIDGTGADDALVNVVEWLAEAAHDLEGASALVIASVRPHHELDHADVDTWLEASDLADDAGIELVEWFVISGEGPSRHIECARDLLGERPRW